MLAIRRARVMPEAPQESANSLTRWCFVLYGDAHQADAKVVSRIHLCLQPRDGSERLGENENGFADAIASAACVVTQTRGRMGEVDFHSHRPEVLQMTEVEGLEVAASAGRPRT